MVFHCKEHPYAYISARNIYAENYFVVTCLMQNSLSGAVLILTIESGTAARK